MNLESIQRDDAVVGRLSRQIKYNLKAPSDFRIGRETENLPEVSEIRRMEYLSDTLVPVNHDGVFKVPIARTPRCSDRLTGKTTLDKYFRAVKTPRRLRDLNFGGFSASSSEMKSLIKRPLSGSAAQQRTVGLGEQKLSFTNSFLSRECYLNVLYFVHPFQKPNVSSHYYAHCLYNFNKCIIY